LQDSGEDGRGCGRAAADGMVDGEDAGDAAADGVVGRGDAAAEDAAAVGAVAQRDDEFGRGHGVVGAEERLFHVDGDGAGDEEHVRVAWAGDELDARAFEIVVGVVEGVDLQLTAVAGAGVAVADGERAAEDGPETLVEGVGDGGGVRWRRRLRLREDAGVEDAGEGGEHGGPRWGGSREQQTGNSKGKGKDKDNGKCGDSSLRSE